MRSPEETLLGSEDGFRELVRQHNGRRFREALEPDAYSQVLLSTPQGVVETQGFVVSFSGEVPGPSGEEMQVVTGDAMLEMDGAISVITRSNDDYNERVKRTPTQDEDPLVYTAFAENPLIKPALAIKEMREDMTRRAEHVRRDKIKKTAEGLARRTTDRIIGSVPSGGVVHLYSQPEAQTA